MNITSKGDIEYMTSESIMSKFPKLERQVAKTWIKVDGTNDWHEPKTPPTPEEICFHNTVSPLFRENYLNEILNTCPLFPEENDTRAGDIENQIHFLKEDDVMPVEIVVEETKEDPDAEEIDNTDFTCPTPYHIRYEMSNNFCDNI
jgi:hypothetical protein